MQKYKSSLIGAIDKSPAWYFIYIKIQLLSNFVDNFIRLFITDTLGIYIVMLGFGFGLGVGVGEGEGEGEGDDVGATWGTGTGAGVFLIVTVFEGICLQA